MHTSLGKQTEKRAAGENMWIGAGHSSPLSCEPFPYAPKVLGSETEVGMAMFDELRTYGDSHSGDITIILLGGRGAQAMYKIIAELAITDAIDELLSRLNVFTQDALAPMRMNNGLSFVRDFERLLGPAFFQKIKSFTPMQTETTDLEGELTKYLEKLQSTGGIDIFFLGLGPEADAASHICYIKPYSGARHDDIAGIIPVSESIVDHHIDKFKAGGSSISEEDEAECRAATHILTLGPAAILGARMIVQSIVDASTAPAKRGSFRRMIETEIAADPEVAAVQLDENPGLWVRFHPNVRSFVLPDLIID
jgi:6-phosphogluconolactonase/glucosamine-6-phosphate isomerase/deaminase